MYDRNSHYTNDSKAQIDLAINDSYKRLLHSSIENEVIKMAKEKADIESVKVFERIFGSAFSTSIGT